MATYLQGVNDYISQVQPSAPNLAFDSQILQSKQSKYDANHKKVSELYGSLLNSAMTRTDNIQSRDEFFKIINTDIQKMGSLDFSLDANVDAAANVFQSIYSNKGIVKDMIWTREFNDQVQVAESFKNCVDPEKCGGQWWEEGDKYMAYKRQEFKTASAAEAMGMDAPQYIPRNNVMEKAIKIAKDANLNMTFDEVTGNYMLTTKNGQQLISPLTKLFTETIGNNPAFAKMYQAKAYVERKDWMYNKINTGEFADENSAAVGYFKAKNDLVQENLQKAADEINVDLGHLTEKYEDLMTKYKAGKIIKNSDEHKQLESLPELIQGASNAKQHTDMLVKANDNASNGMGLRTLGDINDSRVAYDYFLSDISKAAETLAFRDAESTMSADDFAKMKVAHGYSVALEQQKFNNTKALEQWKLDNGLYNDKINSNEPKFKDNQIFEQKITEAENYNPKQKARIKLQNAFPGSFTFSPLTNDPEWTDVNSKHKKVYEEYLKQEIDAKNNLKNAVNKYAIEAKQPFKFTDVITLNDINSSDVSVERISSFMTSLKSKLKNQKTTMPEFTKLLESLNPDESLYYQLQSLGKLN